MAPERPSLVLYRLTAVGPKNLIRIWTVDGMGRLGQSSLWRAKTPSVSVGLRPLAAPVRGQQ